MTAPIAALVRRLTSDTQTATDGELLARYAASRDQTAFELLVWRHAGAVWATCRRVLHPDRAAAEDACQATFLALATHAGRLRHSGAVAGWLRKVAVRASLDLQGRKRCQSLPHEPASNSREPISNAADAELRAALDDGLNRLPDKFRLPFVLCELDGLSNAEAAAVLGCAVGTVESRLTRARQRLRQFLTAKGVQPAVVGGALALPESVRAGLLAVSPESVTAGVRELAARAVGSSFAAKLRAMVAVGMVLVASAVGFGLMPDDRPAPKPLEKAPEPKPVVALVPEPKVPVPDGVLTRLGSPRLRHPAWITDLAFSQDGKRIASVGYDNTIHIWDAETGLKVVGISCAKGETTRLGFADGGKILLAVAETQSDTGELLWIDAVSGEITKRKMVWWKGERRRLYFTHNGALLRWTPESQYASIAQLDTATGEVKLPGVAPILVGTRPEVALSADEKWFAVANGGEVKIEDPVKRSQMYVSSLPFSPPKDGGQIRPVFDRVAIAPDESTVIAHEKTRDMCVAWDVKTKKELWRAENPNVETALLFALGGKTLVAVGQRVAAGTLDAATGKDTGVRFKSAVNCTCAAMHPNGKVVALANTSGTITLFDVATGQPVFPTADPPHSVEHLRFSRDGRTVTGWAADWVKWDTLTGKQTPVTNTGWNYGVPLSPDGKLTAQTTWFSGFRLANDPNDGTRLELRDAATGNASYSHPGKHFNCRWLDFTPDGKGVIGAGHDGTLRVWDIVTGQEKVAFKGHPAPPVAHAFSADGMVLVTASRDAPENTPVRVWHVKTGQELAKFGADAPVLKVAISGDGSRLAVAPYTNSAGKPDPRERVTVWDVTTGTVAVTVPQHGDGGHVALSPCGRLVAASARNKPDVRVYEVATGGVRFHFKHKSEITSLAFAPDCRSLAAASLEAPVYVWDTHDGPGEPPAWDGKQVWKDLASADAAKAFEAMRRVRYSPTTAAAFLRDATRLPTAPPAARLRELVAALGAKEFQTREEATAALGEFGEAIRPELDGAIAAETNPEALRRLMALRARLDIRTSGGVRLLRVVEAVEGLDPAERDPLLRAWASGLFGGRLAAEATAALARRR